MSPYDVLGWMLVGFFAAFMVLMVWVTITAIGKIREGIDQEK